MEIEKISEKLPSIISDPFKKTQIESVAVYYRRGWGVERDKFSATGYVEFKNGETSGKQDFKGDNFDEVVLKIKAMIENLE